VVLSLSGFKEDLSIDQRKQNNIKKKKKKKRVKKSKHGITFGKRNRWELKKKNSLNGTRPALITAH
jgi:hypothetical protein